MNSTNPIRKVLFSFSILSMTLFADAQNFEGKVTMNSTFEMEGATPEEMAMIAPQQVLQYYKGNKSRFEQEFMGMGIQIVITDYDKEETTVLMEFLGRKIAMVSPISDDTNGKIDKDELNNDMKFEQTTEMKTIAGYPCTKTIMTMMINEIEYKTDIWYNDKFKLINKDFPGLRGLAMEYKMSSAGMNMHYLVTEVSVQSVPDDLFNIPVGYEVTTPEAFGNSFPLIKE